MGLRKPTVPVVPKKRFWDYILPGRYKSKLAQYDNEYNYWMWQQQNAYNSPVNQVARYQEAGLSPALMYGQGSPGNAEAGKQAVVPDNTGSLGDAIVGVLDRFMNGRMKLAQIKDVEAAAKLKGAQATELIAETSSKEGLWFKEGMNKLDFDPRDLAPRDREKYYDLERQAAQLTRDLQTVRSSKASANILEKIDNLKNIMMIIQMISGMGGMVGRFIK
jgi:hypothetical protein